MKGFLALVRESVASALSQKVASIVTVIIVAGMCAAVILTTGRTVGAEQKVISSIDTAGTRSIVIRAEPGAGLTEGVLTRISHLDGIEWAGAFGAAVDVQNSRIGTGLKVPLRYAYGSDLTHFGVNPTSSFPDDSAVGSATAIQQLGLKDGVGGVTTSNTGSDFAVVGEVPVPDYLNFLEPFLIVPRIQNGVRDSSTDSLSVLVVIAQSPELVTPVSQAVLSLLAVEDPTKVQVSTSEQLATLRALVQGQLGSFGNSLVIAIFLLTVVLVAAILYGLVMLRRKDFGRRRALGASQGLIVALLMLQMMLLSSIGAVVGVLAASIGLIASDDPLPSLSFMLAVAIFAIFTGLFAALLPAWLAARRDPLKELRVP